MTNYSSIKLEFDKYGEFLPVLATVQELRFRPTGDLQQGDMIKTSGNLVFNDGIGADWVWDPASQAVDDGTSVIAPFNTPAGRWLKTNTVGLVPSSVVSYSQAGIGSVSRSVQDKLRETITPKDFGAVGDGVADDGPALNRMFAYVRSLLASNTYASIKVQGGNGQYRTTVSLNVTNMAAWSLNVNDLYILGECTGKAVFDLVGTRGYVFDNVTVVGHKTNRPTVGFQAQRGTPGGFCDNAKFRDCNTDGWFSKAAVMDYGQETTVWDHCSIYNRDHTARVAVHTGNSDHIMSSDYSTLMSGPTSFINKQFLNMDWRYLPTDENIAFITGVTTGSNSVITMAAGHSYQVGDQVVFQYAGGMPALAGAIATVTNRTATTITTSLNTTGFGTYTSGGAVIRRAQLSPVYINRTEGLGMHDCYVVSYGQPCITFGFSDANFPRLEQIEMNNILFEGAGQSACVYFANTTPVTVQGFRLSTYNAHASGSLMETGTGVVGLFNMQISSVDPNFGVPLVGTPSKFAAYNADVLYDTMANINWEAWAIFTGTVSSINTGKTALILNDELALNDKRTRISGTFASGTATATIANNKPGTNTATATWLSVKIDGTQYWVPAWPN